MPWLLGKRVQFLSFDLMRRRIRALYILVQWDWKISRSLPTSRGFFSNILKIHLDNHCTSNTFFQLCKGSSWSQHSRDLQDLHRHLTSLHQDLKHEEAGGRDQEYCHRWVRSPWKGGHHWLPKYARWNVQVPLELCWSWSEEVDVNLACCQASLKQYFWVAINLHQAGPS